MNNNKELSELLTKYKSALDYAQSALYAFQEHTEYEFTSETDAICGLCNIYDVVRILEETNDELKELVNKE